MSGTVIPLRLKPGPDTVTWEIVTLDPPELVNISFWVELLPTTTVPKFMLDGFGEREPGAMPVPVSEMLRVGFEALLVTARLPLTAPAVLGENVMLAEVL